MLITKKNVSVLFSCIALFSFACFYLHSPYTGDDRDEYIGRSETNIIDVLDYHFLATNFAFTGRFPVTGYILDTGVYKIRPNKEIQLIYLDLFIKNGPVADFIRPPLYPLLVGSIYKVFGFKYYYNLRLNILLLAIIIGLMPLVGMYYWGSRGYVAGLAGALIFLKSSHDHWFLNTMDIEVFSAFIFFLIFATGLLTEKKDKPLYYLIWGISIGLGLLTKPILMLLPVLFAFFMFILYRKGPKAAAAKKVAVLFIGIVLTVSPWTIYINHIQHVTAAQREAWCAKVTASEEKFELSDAEGLSLNSFGIPDEKDPKHDRGLKYLINVSKFMSVYYSRTTGFILITNLGGDGALLNLNNEYCSDGGMHFEWMFDPLSFYRSRCDPRRSTITKVFLFYYHNPSFIFRILAGRLLCFFAEDYHRYFWLAAALWSLCLVQMRLYSIVRRKTKFILTSLLLSAVAIVYASFFHFTPLLVCILFLPLFIIGFFFFRVRYRSAVSTTLPLLWLSLILFMIFIFPNTLYMSLAMPVSCLCAVYFTFSLITGFNDLAFGNNTL